MRGENFYKTKKRVRSKVTGTKKQPRLSVYKSNKQTYAQLIDDEKKVTLVSISTKMVKDGKGKIKIAYKMGEELAKMAKKKKISTAVFDRSGYRYHGRVKAVAEGARKGGLKI